MAKHTYITKRDEPLCDFCCARKSVWRYPCTLQVTMATSVGAVTSSDDWGACDSCSSLIEKKDIDGLVKQVWGSFVAAKALKNVPLSVRVSACKPIREMYVGLLPNLGERNSDSELKEGEGMCIKVVEED
jgi:hypothetical protein